VNRGDGKEDEMSGVERLETKESGETCESCGRDDQPVERVAVRAGGRVKDSAWRCIDRKD
jgi:hypothetical protein